MRDPRFPHALPRAPVDGPSEAGLRVVDNAVRCPHCDKKLGDKLVGTYETTCPRCKRPVTITR